MPEEPKKDEKRSEYISRFVSNDAMQKKYKDRDKRLAIAYSKWRKSKKKK